MSKVSSIVVLVAAMAICASSVAREQSVDDYVATIEGAQSDPGDNGLGRLTIEELMEHFHVPGVSVAVIHDFHIHWAKGYGTADVETGAPVDVHTLFQAASISKPVTAMAVLKAAQEGIFSLDDDINSILTSWHLDGGKFTSERPVTPRTLMSHVSGLGDGFGFPGYDPAGPIPTVIQILDGAPPSNTRPLFMERPPMTAMEYSGGGVLLMQQALVDARGRAFEDILRDDVLKPIGMADSTFEQPLRPQRDRHAARAHGPQGQARDAKWHVYPERAAAGLWTTASDLARFVIEVQKSSTGDSNRVLSRATTMNMLTPVGVGDYAVGFSLQKLGQGWYFNHGGSNWGFQCDLIAHRVHGYGLVIMTNADSGGAVIQELSRRIQRAYEWDSLAPPVPRGYDPPPDFKEIKLPPDVLSEYVGEYQVDEPEPRTRIVITLEAGQLYVASASDPKAALFATERDHFFLRVAPVELFFDRNEDAEVTGFTFVQRGERIKVPKLR
jgi:CubicO group peptidase (beta-lactamase class C family)